MNFLSKETLIDGAALGTGVAVAKVVVNKVGPKVEAALTKANVPAKAIPYIVNALPLVGAFATLKLLPGNRFAQGAANGMFAATFGFVVDSLLQSAGVTGTYGVGAVMMGEVGGESVLMGAAQDMPGYTSTSFDFTGQDAGELDY